MFCKYCGKHNEEGTKFCKECGTPLQPIHPDSGRKLEEEKKRKMRRSVNWIGIIGFVLSIAALVVGIITRFAGTAYIYVAVAALLVCILALSFKKKHSLTGFATAGLLLSCFALSVIAFAIVAVLCIILMAGGRLTRRSGR